MNAALVDPRPIIRPPLKRVESYIPQPGRIIVNDSLPTRQMSEGEHIAVQKRLMIETSRSAPRPWVFGLALVILVAAGVALVTTAALTVASPPKMPFSHVASDVPDVSVVAESSVNQPELPSSETAQRPSQDRSLASQGMRAT